MGLSSNNQLYSYETTHNLWEPIRTKPANGEDYNMQPEIDEHSAIVSDDDMWIFGGFVDGDRVDKAWRFHFPTSEWHAILPKDDKAPSARAGHQAARNTPAAAGAG